MDNFTELMADDSANLHIVNFKFNGEIWHFVPDDKNGKPDIGNTHAIISLFSIIKLKRQYVLEDISKKAVWRLNWPLYISKIIYDDKECKFSLFNKWEIFKSSTGHTEFCESDIKNLVYHSSDLKLNGRVIIYGLCYGKVYSINCSEGNYFQIINFIRKSTSTNLFPFINRKSESKISKFGKKYFAMTLSYAPTGKIPVTMDEVDRAEIFIESHIDKVNQNIIFNPYYSQSISKEFQSRVTQAILSHRASKNIKEEIVQNEKDILVNETCEIDFDIDTSWIDKFINDIANDF